MWGFMCLKNLFQWSIPLAKEARPTLPGSPSPPFLSFLPLKVCSHCLPLLTAASAYSGLWQGRYFIVLWWKRCWGRAVHTEGAH